MWMKIKTKTTFAHHDIDGAYLDGDVVSFSFGKSINQIKVDALEYIFMNGNRLDKPITKKNLETFLDYQLLGAILDHNSIDDIINNRPANLTDFRLPDTCRGNNVCDSH